MTVCAREGDDAGYGKGSVGKVVELGRFFGATQSVRRYVRLWRCVGSRASVDVPCVGRAVWAEGECAGRSSGKRLSEPHKKQLHCVGALDCLQNRVRHGYGFCGASCSSLGRSVYFCLCLP